MDFSLPVTGLAGRRRVLRFPATLAGPPRLFQRLRPRALELQDLGTMHQTTSREGHEVGLTLAPAREGGGPLPGTAKLVGVLAGEDDAAIDDPGDDRGELAGGHRHHRLVEQPQPLLETPVLDQDVAPLVRSEREQVRIAKALPDRRRLARGSRGRLPVAARLLFDDCGHEQIAVLDAITLLPVEQPLGAPEPAAGAAHLPTPGEADADPERAPKRCQLLIVRQVSSMGALEEPEVVLLAANHVRGGGEQLEVVRPERVQPISG